MSEENGKEVAAGIIVRPIQFVWSVVAQIEKDGKIAAHDKTQDMVMEIDFDSCPGVAAMVEKAKLALESKYNGGQASSDGGV